MPPRHIAPLADPQIADVFFVFKDFRNHFRAPLAASGEWFRWRFSSAANHRKPMSRVSNVSYNHRTTLTSSGSPAIKVAFQPVRFVNSFLTRGMMLSVPLLSTIFRAMPYGHLKPNNCPRLKASSLPINVFSLPAPNSRAGLRRAPCRRFVPSCCSNRFPPRSGCAVFYPHPSKSFCEAPSIESRRPT